MGLTRRGEDVGEADVDSKYNILIVGAGLGGLCAASALAKIGANVDVVEIKSETTVPGVGFGLRTNALRALREIGLYDQALAIGFASPTLTYYDRHGDHVVELPFGRQVDGMPNNVLLPRLGFLEIATTRALELGCTLRMSTRITQVEQDADGVSVTFNDGTSGRYDVVIGYDGIKSQIRREFFGQQSAQSSSSQVPTNTVVGSSAPNTRRSTHSTTQKRPHAGVPPAGHTCTVSPRRPRWPDASATPGCPVAAGSSASAR